ncbi:MAG: ABC transporter ATP-binding protein [Ignisphaera sp.]
MALVEVRNLTKIFESGFLSRRATVAVDNVSFDIKSKEIVSLVGESGSGKTTTGRIILRLLPPTSGSVKFEGKDIWRDIKNNSEVKNYWRMVQPVFQDPYASFNPSYKVDRVLNLALRFIGIDEDSATGRDMIREALEYVGLNPSEILGKYPHQLSGGQRQRILIARCWIIKPKLIVADEAVSMVDASLRGSIVALFKKMSDDYGTSILFITHDIFLASSISDRILVMYRGKIVEEGEPDEIIRSPKNEYTKHLIESMPRLYRKWEDMP